MVLAPEIPLTNLSAAPAITAEQTIASHLMDYLPTLRLSFPGGASNSYRIRDNRVEFQINEGPWRVLDDEDVKLHFLLKTEVARWLLRESRNANRMGTGSSPKSR